MPVYSISHERIDALTETSFSERGFRERGDLQRLLLNNIGVVTNPQDPGKPGVLVIAEEFGEWDGARRRIDLLGIDETGNLVVVELKRDDDGGHMELQAIRYAAMVSGMTFARAVDTYASLLAARSSTGGVSTEEARAKLLAFLKWDEPREDDFAQDVRIILVAADFSREITTAVLWLNERGLDIRCVRLKPYVNGQQTLIDAQQVVPLPEAEEYMVQMKEKEQAERSEQAARHSERRAFWTLVLPEITKATGKWKNCSPSDSDWIAAPSGVKGVRWVLRVRQNDCALDLYIDAGPGSQLWNKSVYDSLYSRRREIDSAFGGELSWFRLDGKQASCLTCYPDKIGYRSDREKWPLAARAFADCAKRLDLAVRPYLEGAADSATKNPIA